MNEWDEREKEKVTFFYQTDNNKTKAKKPTDTKIIRLPLVFRLINHVE